MSRLACISSILFSSLLVGYAWAQESASSTERVPKNQAEKPVRRLKGEFKGHPITPPPEGETDGKAPAKKPAAEKKKAEKSKGTSSEKPLVINNALVESGTRRAGGKPAAPRPASPTPAAPRPTSATPAAPPPAPVTSMAPVDLNGHGEVYWRAKAKQVRETLAQAQQTLEAAQLEEKREENDFYSWDDGQYRDNVIKPAWDKSKEESARAREALTAARKAVDDLDDEARRAGAFPGWIRE